MSTVDSAPSAAECRMRPVDELSMTGDSALGLIWFGDTALPDNRPVDLPCLPVPMPLLAHGHPGELWLGQPILGGQYEGIDYRADQQMLFGVLQLHEDDFDDDGQSGLTRASEVAYGRLFALLRQTGYPYLWRTWNYIGQINDVARMGQGTLERYRQFNIGRQAAFDAYERPADTAAPAACALGSRTDSLAIAFIAGRKAPQLIENPRQVSAYHYPDEYGPRSPTFSRAALVETDDQAILFISGTASIVGHRSMHLDDVRAQTSETLANIAALIEETRTQRPDLPPLQLRDLDYRVYVRHPEDRDRIREELIRQVGHDSRASYVQADVCRSELLVEIEATGILPLTAKEATPT